MSRRSSARKSASSTGGNFFTCPVPETGGRWFSHPGRESPARLPRRPRPVREATMTGNAIRGVVGAILLGGLAPVLAGGPQAGDKPGGGDPVTLVDSTG